MYAAVSYQKEKSDPIRVAGKGAMEAVLPYCRTMNTEEGEVPVDPDSLNKELNALMEKGYLALVVAEGPVPGKIGESPELEHVNPELKFPGIAAFIDPLRPDVNEAVQTCTLKISTY